jgi:putative PIN family toxin of toxin-antitoxin system
MEDIILDSSRYTKNLRIVVDTNFLVQVFLNPSGYAAKMLRYIKDYHTLILSDYILYETLQTIEKIALKYELSKRDVSVWRLYLPYIADEMIVLPENYLEIERPKIRDTNDVGIFVTSLLSRSHLLISNDKDLTENKEIQQYVKVIKLEEFVKYVAKQISQEERDLLERLVHKHIE